MVIKGQLRPITADCERLRPIATDKKLTTEQIKVIQLVAEKQKVVRKDVVALLGLSEAKVKEILNSLLGEHLLERCGHGRGTYYQLRND